MFSYIKGLLEEIGENIIILENNGIGYEISTSYNTISSLPGIGSEIKIYTKLIPREDAITLYGFFERDELSMFELLMTVSGIGPKAALSILSAMTVEDVRFAVVSGDSKTIAKANGVGKKTAERVIVDLKDKVDFVASMENKLNNPGVAKTTSRNSSVREEVLEALVSLGYTPSNAAKALDMMQINDNTTTEQLLTDTLRQLSFL